MLSSRPPTRPMRVWAPIAITKGRQRVHLRHVEDAVSLDHQEADAAIRELRLSEQRADQRHAQAEPHAVDDRVAHGRKVDLGHHLPGVGAETLADADEDLVDLAHAAGDVERDRKEAGDRAHRDLRAGADPEPPDHHRKEDNLRTGTEIIEHRLVGSTQQPAAAERNADSEAAQAAENHRNADLVGGRAEVEIKGRIAERCIERFADRGERRHDVAVEPSRRGDRFPDHHNDHDDRDAQRGHRAQRQPQRCCGRQPQSTGLSHRSSLSMRMNTQMLTRITKQIAA